MSGDSDDEFAFGIIKHFHITGLELKLFMSIDFFVVTQHKSLSVFHLMLLVISMHVRLVN